MQKIKIFTLLCFLTIPVFASNNTKFAHWQYFEDINPEYPKTFIEEKKEEIMIKKKLNHATYDYELDNFIVSATFNPKSKTVTIFSKNKEAFFKTGNLQKNYVNALANILCEIGQDFDVLNNPECYPLEGKEM